MIGTLGSRARPEEAPADAGGRGAVRGPRLSCVAMIGLRRIGAGALLCGSVSLLLASTGGGDWMGGQDPVKQPDPDSAANCGQCHTEFYKEWKQAAHAKAWTDPVYQESLKGKKRPQVCHSCHIPREVLARVGRKPRTRKKLLHEGINCVACHRLDDKIHGPFGAETDAHPSVKDPTFSRENVAALCSSCHATKIGPVLPVARDFRKSDFFEKKKKSCVDCHMPKVERHLAVSVVTGKPVGEKRMTRRHAVLGPNDPEFCAKAFDLQVRRDGADVVVTIGNEAGHRVPGLKLRRFPVRVVQLGAEDAESSRAEIVIDHENPLKVLESREFRFPAAAGIRAVRVEIDHHFQGKPVATVLSRRFDL